MLGKTEYLIKVETGVKKGSGTDANVFLVIFGDNGNSKKLTLKNSKTFKQKFQPGQIDVFAFKMKNLG